jgi:hypothetical protein
MSNLATTKLEVTMEDGTEYTVQADQRDYAGWEATEVQGGQHTMIRWWAWSAMKRNGQYSYGFEKFNTKDCVQVDSRAEKKAEAEESDGLDPTS